MTKFSEPNGNLAFSPVWPLLCPSTTHLGLIATHAKRAHDQLFVLGFSPAPFTLRARTCASAQKLGACMLSPLEAVV